MSALQRRPVNVRRKEYVQQVKFINKKAIGAIASFASKLNGACHIRRFQVREVKSTNFVVTNYHIRAMFARQGIGGRPLLARSCLPRVLEISEVDLGSSTVEQCYMGQYFLRYAGSKESSLAHMIDRRDQRNLAGYMTPALVWKFVSAHGMQSQHLALGSLTLSSMASNF